MAKDKKTSKEISKRYLGISSRLSEQARQALLLVIQHQQHQKVTSSSLANILRDNDVHVSRQAASRYLRELEKHEERFLVKRGKGRNTHYAIWNFDAIKKHLHLTKEEEAMLSVYNEWRLRLDENDDWISEVQSEMAKASRERPLFFFDVKNVIHKAFVCDGRDIITQW